MRVLLRSIAHEEPCQKRASLERKGTSTLYQTWRTPYHAGCYGEGGDTTIKTQQALRASRPESTRMDQLNRQLFERGTLLWRR